MARASPITICAVVLVVGAKLLGQASLATCVFKTKSACFPKKDAVLPVIPISLLGPFLMSGTNIFISGVLPLLEMHMTTSSSCMHRWLHFPSESFSWQDQV